MTELRGYQIVRMAESGKGGVLFQGCHPSVYGHEEAWKRVDLIIDLSSGPYHNQMYDLHWPDKMPDDRQYVRWNIEDGDVPDLRSLERIGRFGADYFLDGGKLLVHCAAGQNRSALVTATVLYFAHPSSLLPYEKREGLGEEIYKAIKTLNPYSFTNPMFERFVRKMEQYFLVGDEAPWQGQLLEV